MSPIRGKFAESGHPEVYKARNENVAMNMRSVSEDANHEFRS
jgi:hypothetical protein